MEFTYMGLFDKIFDFVLSKIFSPVFEFLSGLISSALSWCFNNVLGPLLKDVLWPLIQETLKIIVKALAGILYGIFSNLLKFIDYISEGFDYMVGLKEVTYKATTESSGESVKLLELVVFKLPGVSDAFWAISMVALILLFLFTIYSVIKSILDFEFENKKPVSRVLSSFLKSFLQLFTVQFFVFFIVKFSGVLLSAVNTSINTIQDGGRNTSIAKIIFCVSSLNAANKGYKKYNLNTKGADINVGIMDAIRKPFYNGSKDYLDLDQVEKFFDIAEFDYLIGFVLAIFMLVMLGMCLVVFVQRMFDVMMLYLISPYFVAMMPLDDGQRFGKWRELFIGKVFSGFGIVIAMRLYIMLCPSIIGGNVTFMQNSIEMDYLAKMVFLLGGAWATLKSGNILTSLLSDEAGRQEAQTSDITVGLMKAAGSKVADVAGSMASYGFKKIGNKFGSMMKSSKDKFEDTKFKESKDGDNKIPGINSDGGISEGAGSGGGNKLAAATALSSGSGGNAGPSSGGAIESPNTTLTNKDTTSNKPLNLDGDAAPSAIGTDLSDSAEATGNSPQNLDGDAAPSAIGTDLSDSAEATGNSPQNLDGDAASAAIGTNITDSAEATGNSPQNLGESSAQDVSKPFFEEKPKASKSFPLGFKQYKLADGSTRTGFKLGGSLLGMKRDGAGTKLSFLGFSLRLDTNGKVSGFKIPLINLKKKRASDGKMHTSKLNILGLASFKANTQTGKLQFSKCSLLGMENKYDKSGNLRSRSVLGFKQKRQENGELALTSAPLGMFQASYKKNAEGKLEMAGVRALGINWMIDEDVVRQNREKRMNEQKKYK